MVKAEAGQNVQRRAKRVFPEALTHVSFSWGGPFFAGKMHGTFKKHCSLQHFEAQTASPNFWCYNFAARL